MPIDHLNRAHLHNEARDDYLRVYPIKGDPIPGYVPTVNADGDLEYGLALGSGMWVPYVVLDEDGNPGIALSTNEDGAWVVSLMWEAFT